MAEASLHPYSVSSLADPGFPDTVPPQSQDPQGGPADPPCGTPGANPSPPEGGDHQGPVGQVEAGGSPLRDQTPGEAAPQDTPESSKGSSLPQEGAGPTACTREDRPRKEDGAQERSAPDSAGDSQPGREPRGPGQQAGAQASGVSC